MAFTKKTWIDRVAEFPNRRKLNGTGITDTYDVVRNEGNIIQAGDAFNAETMNDLESRVDTAVTAAGKTAEWTGVTGAPDFLPKTGGTMTSPIIFSDPMGTPVKTHIIQYQGASYFRNVVDDNNYKDIFMHKDADIQYSVNANGVLKGYKIYGEHNVTVSTAAPTSVLPDGYIHMVY